MSEKQSMSYLDGKRDAYKAVAEAIGLAWPSNETAVLARCRHLAVLESVDSERQPTLDTIIDAVLAVSEIPLDELRSARRGPARTTARQAIIVMARHCLPPHLVPSFPDIARAIRPPGTSHSGVITTHDRALSALSSDPPCERLVNLIYASARLMNMDAGVVVARLTRATVKNRGDQ